MNVKLIGLLVLGIGIAIAQTAPRTVDFRQLRSLLPATLAGLPRVSLEGSSLTLSAFRVSQAVAKYENNQNARLELQFIDLTEATEVNQLVTWFGQVQIDSETETGFQRTSVVRGFPALEAYDRADRSGEIQLLVGGRFWVQLSGSEVTFETLQRAISEIALPELVALAGASGSSVALTAPPVLPALPANPNLVAPPSGVTTLPSSPPAPPPPAPPAPIPEPAAVAPAPPPFAFSVDRPNVVVLLHGITSKPSDAPQEAIGTFRHPRYYWGNAFITNILGLPPANERLNLLQVTRSGSGFNVTGLPISVSSWGWNFSTEQFTPLGQGFDNPNQPQLAPIFSSLPTGNFRDQAMRTSATFNNVMVTFRAGHLNLIDQAGAAIDQIFDSYQAAFGALPPQRQPQIFLIGHSFGGIIGRTILVNPAQADSISGKTLGAEQRRRADFIRDRTVSLSTLSTPHTGSPSTEFSNKLNDRIQALKQAIAATKPPNAYIPFTNVSVTEANRRLTQKMVDALGDVQKIISANRPVFEDIKRVKQHNVTLIKPGLERRGDGTLIPVYTMAGRSPGHYFYDRRRAAFGLNEFGMGDVTETRAGKEATALMAFDILMSRMNLGSLSGSSDVCRTWRMVRQDTFAPIDGDRRVAPRVCDPLRGPPYDTLRSNFKLGSSSDVSDTLLYMISGAGYVGALTRNGYASGHDYRDGEYDSDGMVGFDSSHGLSIKASNWFNLYGSTYGTLLPWELDNHGSLMFNPANGLWIRQVLLRNTGPFVSRQSTIFSLWNRDGLQTPVALIRPLSKVTVTIENIKPLERLDSEDRVVGKAEKVLNWGLSVANTSVRLTGPDFRINTEIAGVSQVFRYPDDKDEITADKTFSWNVTGHIIPIRIALDDIDNEQSNAIREELLDPVTVTPAAKREDLYFYYEIATGRIFGDITGQRGQSITVTPAAGAYNRASLRIKVNHALRP